MKKLKKLLFVILMVISMVILSMLLKSIVANAADRDREATLEDIMAENPVGDYKYVFTHTSFRDWDNLACVHRSAILDCHSLDTSDERHLHKLTTYVEINGENAKFYARRSSFYFTRRNFNT